MRSEPSPLTLYTRAAQRSANAVIESYSTSFGLATRLLGARHRTHVRNVYALVRVADEIVDGVAAEAGLDPAARRAALDAHEAAAMEAIATGFSTDLVVHAFAVTAREAGIGADLVAPFYDAMRTDLEDASVGSVAIGVGSAGLRSFDAGAHDRYVYGSAQVVGLMCLAIFVRGGTHSAPERAALDEGARSLGAAFQDVNFLRDLARDTDELGRSYLTPDGRLTAADKDALIARIRAQLRTALDVVPLLPRDARAAVRSAAALFGELTDRLDRASVEDLYRTRVRVPDPVKAALAARAVLVTSKEKDR